MDILFRERSTPAQNQPTASESASKCSETDDEYKTYIEKHVCLVARHMRISQAAVNLGSHHRTKERDEEKWQCDQEMAQVFAQHADRDLFQSLPGAGPVLAPRLLAALGSERERFARAANLQCLSAIAPVTKQSGGKCHVHRRYLGPNFLKQSFHEYAQESILHSRWAAAYYGQQRKKGCGHHTSVRALAYKWQRILWRCWQSRTPYQEEIYEAALRKSRSPLVPLLDQIELGKSPVKTRTKKS
ncbi:MAG: IS110 family transposase [Verrucomicrobiota bacterium]